MRRADFPKFLRYERNTMSQSESISQSGYSFIYRVLLSEVQFAIFLKMNFIISTLLTPYLCLSNEISDKR